MSDRDCEKCKHHTEKGCDSWDCEFEQKMTRKEAIDELCRLLSDCISGAYPIRNNAQKGRYRQAVKIAINSLEIDERYELEYEQIDHCEDAISRQAVLDVIKFEYDWLLDAKGHNADTKIAFSGIKSKVLALPPVNPQEPKTGHWILSSEKMPENPSIVACDAYNNKPWIPRGILITETENGKKKLYDAATYNGNLKAFLKGKELTSFSGNTFYLSPREIIAWMPLPKPYNPQEESEGKE